MSNKAHTRGRKSSFGMEVLETRKLAANFGFGQVDMGSDQPEMIEATAEVGSQRIQAGVDATFKVDQGGGLPDPCFPEGVNNHGNVFPGDGSTGSLEPSSVDAALQSNDWYTLAR